jgi:hypothetical protein
MKAAKWNRKLHRWGAVVVAVPLVIVVVTGVMLQLKKKSDWIQPPLQRGSSEEPTIGFDRILDVARTVPEAEVQTWEDIDRLDVRPVKGVVKVRCKNRWEIQIDTNTGEVLQVAVRRSDLIESIHDGSFLHDGAKWWVFLPSALILAGLWGTGLYLFLRPYITRRKRKSIALLLFAIAMCLSPASSAVPGGAAEPDASVERDRNWMITIPLWLPGYRGEFAIGDIEIDGESSGGSGFLSRFFDSKWRLNFFFMGAFSYQRDRWRVHGDMFGGKFTDDVIWKPNDATIASASVQPIIPRLHVDYRVLNHPWGDSGYQEIQGWIYAGVRYYDMRIEAEAARLARSLETHWADPIVGVWIPANLSRRWMAELSGDVGGFHVGSKLSWQISGMVSFKVSPLVAFALAYHVLDVDYRDTVKSQDFLYRVRVAGPGFGIRFNF